jgi:cytochrome P450
MATEREGRTDAQAPAQCPETDLDPWADGQRLDPFPLYRELRDLGPVVWLRKYGVFALTRFDEVKQALTTWEQFSSAKGVSLSDGVNAMFHSNVLTSDPPEHTDHRKVLANHLSAKSLRDERPDIEQTAVDLIDDAVAQGTVDGADLAKNYSLKVVCDMVGFPEEGRSEIPDRAALAFNLMGPEADRSDSWEALHHLGEHARASVVDGRLTPGRRGERMMADGLEPEALVNFTWPGIDTTVHGISGALHQLAQNPDQWELIRQDRSLIPAAFAEALRLHTPVHHFTRWITEPTEIGGVVLPAEHRAVVMYGSANRDERHYPDPDRFDVARNPTDQLAFGRGIHLCVGIHLAKLEGHSFLNALADRVERIELTGPAELLDNETLHGMARLPLRLVEAGTE